MSNLIGLTGQAKTMSIRIAQADRVPSVAASRSKSLSREQNDEARSIFRKFLNEDFDGNQSRAARALGIDQSAISLFLTPPNGLGAKLLAAVASLAPSVAQEMQGIPETPESARVRKALVQAGYSPVVARWAAWSALLFKSDADPMAGARLLAETARALGSDRHPSR